MNKTEAALILRAIYSSEYKMDKREEELMHDIKLKLMNIHPDQVEAREKGDELVSMLTTLLITFCILLLTSSVLVYNFV